MATLANQTIANTYDSLLHVEDDTAGLVATSTDSRVIQDGVGANSALALATDSVRITSTNRLYFNDVGGEYISGSTSVLSIVGGSEIDLTATAIDINGTADVSGTLTVGGTLTVNAAAVFNEASADVDFRVEGNGEANLLFCDASTDRVGIGTAAPDNALHVVKSDDDKYIALLHNSSVLGYGLHIKATSGSGSAADSIFFCQLADGVTDRFQLRQDGNVYIPALPSSAGNADMRFATGTGQTSYDSSDQRLKRDITSYDENALSVIGDLSVKNFYWKSKETVQEEWPEAHYDVPNQEILTQKQIGLIAQEINQVIPDFCSAHPDSGLYGISYKGFVPYLIKAVQELSAKVEALENA